MFFECKMMNTTLRAFVEQLRKQIDSEVGALRGAPARKGRERGENLPLLKGRNAEPIAQENTKSYFKD